MKEVHVLFTSVGRRVELIHAFEKAYRDLGLKGNIVGIDMDPLAPALSVVDKYYLVPSLQSAEYISTLEKICDLERISVVFPLIDPDILVLAENRSRLESNGCRVSVVSKESAVLTADKWLTTRFFKELGLAVPHSWLPQDLDPVSLSYPVFIKPRKGSASKKTYLARNQDELQFFLAYVPEPIIQEYLPGPEITNDVVCDLNGKILSIVSRKRIEVRSGEVAKGVTIYDTDITLVCKRIAEALPAVGPITIQCIMKENVPHFTEINARFGGGAPLGFAAGAESPKYFLAGLAGLPLQVPPLGTYRINLYMTRFDDAIFLDETQQLEMERNRI